jgi:hypothetical protein
MAMQGVAKDALGATMLLVGFNEADTWKPRPSVRFRPEVGVHFFFCGES